jgi:hypothetical protein
LGSDQSCMQEPVLFWRLISTPATLSPFQGATNSHHFKVHDHV